MTDYTLTGEADQYDWIEDLENKDEPTLVDVEILAEALYGDDEPQE